MIQQAGRTVDSFLDNTGTAHDSLATGVYDITISSANLLCPTQIKLNVTDGGVYPFTPKVEDTVFYCLGDNAVHLNATADSGAVPSLVQSRRGAI